MIFLLTMERFMDLFVDDLPTKKMRRFSIAMLLHRVPKRGIKETYASPNIDTEYPEDPVEPGIPALWTFPSTNSAIAAM